MNNAGEVCHLIKKLPPDVKIEIWDVEGDEKFYFFQGPDHRNNSFETFTLNDFETGVAILAHYLAVKQENNW